MSGQGAKFDRLYKSQTAITDGGLFSDAIAKNDTTMNDIGLMKIHTRLRTSDGSTGVSSESKEKRPFEEILEWN